MHYNHNLVLSYTTPEFRQRDARMLQLIRDVKWTRQRLTVSAGEGLLTCSKFSSWISMGRQSITEPQTYRLILTKLTDSAATQKFIQAKFSFQIRRENTNMKIFQAVNYFPKWFLSLFTPLPFQQLFPQYLLTSVIFRPYPFNVGFNINFMRDFSLKFILHVHLSWINVKLNENFRKFHTDYLIEPTHDNVTHSNPAQDTTLCPQFHVYSWTVL
jgi:hypothetical protein